MGQGWMTKTTMAQERSKDDNTRKEEDENLKEK